MTDNPSPYRYSTPQIQRAKLDWQAVEELAPASADDTTLFSPDAVAQAGGMFGMGLHILFGELMPLQLEALIPFCARNRVAWVVIMGEAGGQFTQCLDYVQRFRVGAPDTNVIVRMWPDDGRIKAQGYDPAKVYQQIAPYRARMVGMGVWWLIDNESNETDLTQYSLCTAAVMELAGNDGLGIAWGRFATGVPDDGHELRDAYGLGKPRGAGELDAMLLAGSKWRYVHVQSPNEYFGLTASLTAGHVGRYERYLTRYAELGVPPPRIVIGEYGMIGNYQDAESGFRRYKSDGEFFAMARDWYETYYQPNNVAVCFYAVCSRTKRWRDFDVQGDAMTLIGQYATTGRGNIEMTLPAPPQPQPIQPTPPIGDPKRVRIGGNRNLRRGPHDTLFSVIRTIVEGTEFDIHPDTMTLGNGYAWYWTGDGWISDARGVTLFGAGSAFAEVATPAPPVPGLPDVEASVWTPRRLTLPRELLDAPFLEAGQHTDDNGNVFDHEAGTVLVTVPSNTVLAIYLDILYSADGHDFIGVKVTLDGVTRIGWMPVVGNVGLQFVALEPVPPVEPPPVEEDDTQPGPPMDDKAARQAAWKLLKEGHEARAVAQQAMREADDLIAQGWQALMLLEDLNNEEAA